MMIREEAMRMPYPRVTQLETRLRLDLIATQVSRPRPSRRRRPWRLALRIVDVSASRNVGGYR